MSNSSVARGCGHGAKDEMELVGPKACQQLRKGAYKPGTMSVCQENMCNGDSGNGNGPDNNNNNGENGNGGDNNNNNNNGNENNNNDNKDVTDGTSHVRNNAIVAIAIGAIVAMLVAKLECII
jgi:hypothetical protein